MLGNGDGTFGAEKELPTDEADAIAFADIDGDHIPDLVIAESGEIIVFVGPDYSTQQKTSMPTALRADDVAVADLDLDGAMDIVVVGENDNTVAIFFGSNSLPVPAPLTIDIDSLLSSSVALGDINNDSYLDIVLASPGYAGVVTLVQSGKTFSAWNSVALPSGSHFVHLADLDGDKNLDVVLSGDAGLITAKGDGKGNFKLAQKLVSATEIDDTLVLDVATHGLANMNGTFGSPTLYTDGSMPSWLTSGDFDGDGRIDVISASQQTGVTYVRNLSH